MTPLVAHPATPVVGVTVAGNAERTPDALRIRYRIGGGLERVVVPSPGPARRADRLWEHTCVEAFFGPVDSPAYVELNVAPSGAWAVFAFRAYRAAAAGPGVVPRIAVDRRADAIDVAVTMPLVPALRATTLRLGLSAVLELRDGARTYWALRHPAGRPDFHHDDAFALVL